MSVRITVGDYGVASEAALTQRIQFVLSPVNELFRSLHVLLNPKHHGQNLAWVLAVKDRLTPELYADLQYFRVLYELETPAFLIPAITKFMGDFETEFQQLFINLKEMDPAGVTQQIKHLITERENAFIPTLARGAEWGGFAPTSASRLISDLATDPVMVYHRFKQFLTMYVSRIFGDVLTQQRIVPRLVQEIQEETVLLQRGFSHLIDALQRDRIFWNNNKIVVTKPFDQEIDIGDSGVLLLVPSLFTWPHLFVSQSRNNAVINYGFDKITSQDVFPSLERLFKVLGDPLRLRILMVLNEQPQTTQTLASSLGCAESTVSRDLQLLKESGVIIPHRQGKFVFYRVTGKITRLMPRFFEYLDKNNN
ncbi:DUF5937 family protein [Ligilactobacillus sp. LYQ60]|uniref:ArsR/SmtB family transcription factor n=1 Tax=unclassified Ligilactobacillus TaxID=2767920 RepID=UPI00385386A0